MYNSYGWQRQEQQEQPLPLHLCFFLLITFLLLSMSWYLNYESALESLLDQVKLVVALSPLVLLLVVHWLSAAEPGRFPLFIPLLERDSLQFSGGSPWGVALALVLLLFMVSYQSYFHEHWFPLRR